MLSTTYNFIKKIFLFFLCSFQEKTISRTELINYLQRYVRTYENNHDSFLNNSAIARSESKTSYSDKSEHNHDVSVAIQFVAVDKISANTRRRYENQVTILFSKMAIDKKLFCLFLSVATSRRPLP